MTGLGGPRWVEGSRCLQTTSVVSRQTVVGVPETVGVGATGAVVEIGLSPGTLVVGSGTGQSPGNTRP